MKKSKFIEMPLHNTMSRKYTYFFILCCYIGTAATQEFISEDDPNLFNRPLRDMSFNKYMVSHKIKFVQNKFES